MYGTILTFIKFNNFGTQHLNGPRRLFLSFCCTTRRIFEPLRVFEPGFNMDKYGICLAKLLCLLLARYTHGLNYALCTLINTIVTTVVLID